MKLDEYLKDKNKTHFARAIGTDYATLWRWRKGIVMPSKQIILKIQEMTNDAVRPEDWFK